MASKTVELPGIGPITLYKRRGSRHIRLSVTADGKARVSMPTWVPYATGIAFARDKAGWLQQQLNPPAVLRHGMRIGKKHRIEVAASPHDKITTRVDSQRILIRVPVDRPVASPPAQQALQRACIRALRQEAEDDLPEHLRQLAIEHGFKFKSVEVKQLRSRWGSCNHRNEIVLNCFLMQLPWELIDYVLLHELMHTRIMAHGPKFWSELSNYVPNLAEKRRLIRDHRPTITEAISMSGMA